MHKGELSMRQKKTKENDEKTYKQWLRKWSIIFRRMK